VKGFYWVFDFFVLILSSLELRSIFFPFMYQFKEKAHVKEKFPAFENAKVE
jgi:hypothetical protein